MNNPGNILFSVSTMVTTAEGTIRAMKPDASGAYRGVPLAVLGKPSTNGIFYDVPSTLAAMNNPNTKFNRCVKQGALEAEWGHPFTANMSREDEVRRSLYIDRNLVSHRYVHIYAKRVNNELIIIYGDIVPTGPNKNHIIEYLESPISSASFSLRAITAEMENKMQGAIVRRTVAMVTFDGVVLGGFLEASDRGIDISTEEGGFCTEGSASELFNEDVLRSSLVGNDSISYESLNCQEILDTFQSDVIKVSYTNKPFSLVRAANGSLIGANSRPVSPFHSLGSTI